MAIGPTLKVKTADEIISQGLLRQRTFTDHLRYWRKWILWKLHLGYNPNLVSPTIITREALRFLHANLNFLGEKRDAAD